MDAGARLVSVPHLVSARKQALGILMRSGCNLMSTPRTNRAHLLQQWFLS